MSVSVGTPLGSSLLLNGAVYQRHGEFILNHQGVPCAVQVGPYTVPTDQGQFLPPQVSAILNKYGATMLLPGVSGAMRFGYQPGNYRESTGQTLAAADQQVGLVVDAAWSVGLELVAGNNLSTAVDAAGSTSHTNTSFTTTAPDAKGVTLSGLVVGKWYQVVSSGSTTAPEFSINTADAAVPSARTLIRIGFGNAIFKADYTYLYLRHSAAGVSSNISISVRELPGIHASQSTSGFQPVLRNTAGIQSWQFDGTDDRLSLSAVPFQMADDHFVVIGATRGGTGATRRLFHVGSGGDIPRVACLSFSSTGIPEVNYRNDSGNFVLVTGDTAWPQSPVVLSATSIATALRLRADSALLATGTRPTGATTLTAAAVGAHTAGTAYFNGHIHGIIFGKGAITDAELLTLERFVASLQGRVLS